MQERNSLSFRAQPWFLVDQSNTGLAAAFKHVVQVVDGKANVMYAGPALGDEFSNRRIVCICLKEFHERFATGHPCDACTIGIVEWYLGHLQNIAQEG